jgi:hypothetical protein
MSPSPITIGAGNGARPRPILITPAQGVAPPAQGQTPRAGQAELVICDQTIEGAFAELKVSLPGERLMLRSRRADLAEQELWGLLLAHFALRRLMHEASRRAGRDPDALSFLRAVRVVRRHLPFHAAFSPSPAPPHA